jgi:hypothetical protein
VGQQERVLNYKVSDRPLDELKLSFVTEFEHYLLTVEKLQLKMAILTFDTLPLTQTNPVLD